MRFFNLDLHISVIADIRQIFVDQGHEVTDWTISGHAWVMGREPTNTDVITSANWQQIDKAMCDAFYERYRDELAGYDAFIVTHTPCFAMLYERWNKPIIVVASTRYEQPFTGEPAKWEAFNSYLRKMRERGLLIPLSNNKYDGAYARAFTGFDWPTIPSLCEYVEERCRLERPEHVIWGEYRGFDDVRGIVTRSSLSPKRSLVERAVRKVLRRPARPTGHSWRDLAAYSGVVHVPYNASLMSMFEHYANAFPIAVPSRSFLRELYEKHPESVLSQLSFRQVYGLPSGSPIPFEAESDPNDFENIDAMMKWVELADFYDEAEMPFIAEFSSIHELAAITAATDPASTQAKMLPQIASRRARVHAAWAQVIAGLPT